MRRKVFFFLVAAAVVLTEALVICRISGDVKAERAALQEHPDLPKYVNPVGDEFPIMAWFSFNDSANINRERFLEMRDAGFNIYMALLDDTAMVCQSLRAADGTGVKVLVNCHQLHYLSLIPETVARVKDNPNVAGYFIVDEPPADKFKDMALQRDAIYKADSTHLVFINLFPIVTAKWLKADSYRQYLKEYFDTIRMPLLSYDCYPIEKQDGKLTVKKEFYKNLEEASKICREYKRPFWAFCLSTQHYDYPEPTDGHLRFEAFSALAYGAQGLEYFTYTHPYFSRDKFKNPPIDSLGRKTKVWYRVKKINEEVQGLSSLFLGCDVKGVWHTGRTIPEGTRRLETVPAPFRSIESDGEGIVVSEFTSNGKDYVMLVNRNPERKQRVRLGYDKNPIRVYPGGKLETLGKNSITLPAGGYAIFTD